MFDTNDLQPKLDLTIESTNIPGEVLHAGQWYPATVLSIPSENIDPRQRIQAWKVQVHVGEGITKYFWNSQEIKILNDS